MWEESKALDTGSTVTASNAKPRYLVAGNLAKVQKK
jgi:hypothetical protein